MATRKPKNAAAPAAATAAIGAALSVPGLDAAHSEALVELSAATHDPARNNFMFVQPVFADALAAAGFAEVHPTMTDEHGNKASRSTPTGDAAAATYVQAKQAAAQAPAATAPAASGSPFGTSASAAFGATATAPAPAPQTPAPAAATKAAPAAAEVAPSNFKIAANVPIPEAQRFGKTAVYPFDALQVGQSFFVPVTAARPNPAKSVASTVNSANKRLAPKNFAVRRVEDGAAWGQPGVAGAGVWRMA